MDSNREVNDAELEWLAVKKGLNVPLNPQRFNGADSESRIQVPLFLGRVGEW